MAKKYELFKNAPIAKGGVIEKITELDLEAHGLSHINGADAAFRFIVTYNKSDAVSDITITYEVSFDGLLWLAAAAAIVTGFAGAAGTPNFQDVTGVTAVRGWDMGQVVYVPRYIKVIITENDVALIEDIDSTLIAY